jgi:hypothetical protein
MVIYQGIGPTPRGRLARVRKEDYARLYEESKGKGETFLGRLMGSSRTRS